MLNWLDLSRNANLLRNAYIKGILDISGGSIIVRNGNAYIAKDISMGGNFNVEGNGNFKSNIIINGNTLLKGNLYLENINVNGDISLNSRLFVKNDISINGNLQCNGTGNFNGNLYVQGVSIRSDRRAKYNIKPLSNFLNILNKLKPSSFQYENLPDSKLTYGFIADEIQEIFPNIVNGDKNDIYSNGEPKYQTIDYIQLISILTSIIQELNNDLVLVKNKICNKNLQELEFKTIIDIPFDYNKQYYFINNPKSNFTCNFINYPNNYNSIIKITLIISNENNYSPYFCNKIEIESYEKKMLNKELSTNNTSSLIFQKFTFININNKIPSTIPVDINYY